MAIDRQTRQKELIRKEIENIDKFFTADQIYEKVKNKDKKIGIATIYRYLKKLKEENKIYFYICSGKKVYSKLKKSHCHFIDEKTGKTIHFEIDNIDFIKNKIDCDISSFSIEVRGELK